MKKKYILCRTMLSISILGALNGCSKKMDCDIKDNHVHKYVSELGTITYFDSENEIHDGYKWTDNVIKCSKQSVKQWNYLEKHDLIPIVSNETYIESNENNTYYAYKLVKSPGYFGIRYSIQKSDIVNDLSTISDEYEYIKINDFYELEDKQKNIQNKNLTNKKNML